MYSNNLICDVLEYIDRYLLTRITIDDLEHTFFYNRYYLMKLFKKEMHITIFDYINKLRINNSLSELNETHNLLIKIALNNGFSSLEYFSEMFKREIGVSPRKYRQIITNKYYDDNKTTIIINNIISIKKIIDRANKYKQNRRRTIMPIKKLSIFK